tara:strand:+ start:2726 stop:3949 length:1224 start_codon:yes stop_codon:yes gene_type:complete
MIKNVQIGVIGLGYVGLPVSMAFAEKYKVIGYDLDKNKITRLNKKIDSNKEFLKRDFNNKHIFFSNKINDLENCNVYIVAVPTPIFINKKPNLNPLKRAMISLSKILKKNDFVVLESTVTPGTSENYCIPILEKSGLKINEDFYFCFSPERINPADKKHTFKNINKVISCSSQKKTGFIKKLYSNIITAKIYDAKFLKVAEAAKIIENVQRDINISFINYITMLFSKENINIHEVLKASATKWNFLNFKPGLVGGHCIGVDPYYLIELDKKKNNSLVTLSRKINESMINFYFNKIIFEISKKNYLNSRVLFLGASFKENVPDLRNSKYLELYVKLQKKIKNLFLYDSLCNFTNIQKKKLNFYDLKLKKNNFDVVILAVHHNSLIKIFKKNSQINKKKIFHIDLQNLF